MVSYLSWFQKRNWHAKKEKDTTGSGAVTSEPEPSDPESLGGPIFPLCFLPRDNVVPAA